MAPRVFSFVDNVEGRSTHTPMAQASLYAPHAELAERGNHRFFEFAHVAAYGEFVIVETDDGISDELAWAMEGDVAASVGFDDFNAHLGQGVGGSEKIFLSVGDSAARR